MDNWDFDCPQFVDFAADLNRPSNDDFQDISSDVQSGATNDRNDMGPKMATPKLKPNDPLKNFPFMNFRTDDEKIATLSTLPSRLSKSEGSINKVVESLKSPEEIENPRLFKTRRISFSGNYIKKKKVCPTTPNCLKRTVQNSKSKVAKSSEELELQKIAELRDMLHKQLRLNKINMKRIKMNKAPFTLERLPKKNVSKVPAIKNDLIAPPKPAPLFNRKLNPLSNLACGAAAFSRGIKLTLEGKEAVLKRRAPFNILRDVNNVKKDNALKKQPLFEKYDAHGGLNFLPHQEKTTCHPFSFDSSYASSHNTSKRAANLSKLQTPLSVSRNNPCLSANKENLVK